MLSRNNLKLTLAGAKAMLAAAEQKAAALKVPQCMAIVDDGGHLMAFSRMDGAKISSVQVAITKAISAATRRSATGPVPSAENASLLLSLGLSLATDGRLTPIRGGLPIVVEGQVVGGVGVSAGTEDQDVEVAQAALAALKS